MSSGHSECAVERVRAVSALLLGEHSPATVGSITLVLTPPKLTGMVVSAGLPGLNRSSLSAVRDKHQAKEK